ncbi:MAG TPA: UvrD-helicase domain-containing protein [Planctomycetota bacterium]|nr:UvrD-helicase domain-containing protein [Planctomycetota bacterium]
MGDRLPPQDQADRDRAIRSSKNLAVTAGAGTGKTTLLVDKILHRVLADNVKIERILALTFTEKAANEMRHRLRIALRKRDRLEGLEKAEIGTIHGFCAHLLREFPLEAGVAPDVEVDDGAVFRRRFDAAWPKWLDRELGPDARRPNVWKEVLRKVTLRELRDLAVGLSSFSVPDGRRAGGPALLAGYVTEFSAKVPKLAGALAGKAEPQKSIKGAVEGVALKLAKDVAKLDESLIAKAVGLIDDFATEFRADFLRSGHVSFDGILLLVHRLLHSDVFPGVIASLRDRYQCILVDEFQDTDPVQGEIIRKLAEDASGRLVPGKLFIVGDPKQSIYSFRGADIIAYQGIVDELLRQGGEPVVLRTNFRSHGKILDLVNATFSRVIQKNARLQPPYEPIEPAEDAKQSFPDPTIEAILIDDASADESREMEAEEIAEWIEAHPDIPKKDIAILLRSLVDVTKYLEALRARKIPYVVEGEKYFYGTSEVVDFVNVLRAVANPHDRLAVVGVLRSPYGGVSDQDLYDRRKSLDYRLPSPWPIFGYLKRWHAESGKTGVRDLVDLIFRDISALEIAQSGYHGEQAVANLLKLRAKAAELESKAGCTLREFLDAAMLAVRDLEEEGESPLADETLDAVRILSIHRAKGLEYPVVILPDLHRAKQGRQIPTVRYDWPTGTLGVKLGDAMNAGAAALGHLDREREREEWRRLLYVAVTRAKELLLLLGSAGAKDESFLGLLLPDLQNHARLAVKKFVRPPFRAPPELASKKVPDWEPFLAKWKEREGNERPAERFTSPSRMEEAGGVDRILFTSEASLPPSRASEIGTACHAVLEHLDFKAPAIPEGTDPDAAAILRKFFKSAPFKALAKSEIVARELPFVIPREGQVIQGVIDVVYRSGGKTYVADYKTDTLVEPEKYGLIRDVYTEAVRRVLKVEPQFQLIYLRQGRAVDA